MPGCCSRNGTGVWLSAIGWQLLAASNAIVITFLGHPEWVPIYSCTAKLSLLTTQLTWVPPDSALVGLAQLHGERQGPDRLRRVVLMMLRLHLLLGGAALCGLLAFNPAFVTQWVGAEFFGGRPLNALLALGVVLYSLVHGLITMASVVGNRLKVGVLALANGVVQTVLALAFGRWWGLEGIAVAGLVAAFCTSVPLGLLLLRPATNVTAGASLGICSVPGWFARRRSWCCRPSRASSTQSLGLVLSGCIAAADPGGLRVESCVRCMSGLPLGRWADRLVRIGLMPAVGPVSVGPDPVLDRA